MTNYVLEILDGDQAGTIVALVPERISLGRRGDNTVVLKDEKCSGHHAEIVFEDGGWVLRDAGSTNGTLLDGKRVTEVALTPFDVFQLGRVRIAFKEEGKDAPVDDVQVARLDAEMLARSRKKRGSFAVSLLGLVVIAGGAFFAWQQFVRPKTSSGGAGAQAKPLKVAGNLLADGDDDFEADEPGWNWQASLQGSAFEIEVSRALAHSGTVAMVARRADSIVAGADEAGTPEVDARPRSFALARLTEPVRVSAGQAVVARAHATTEGTGAFALRAVFASSLEDGPPRLRTGTAPRGFAGDWAEVELAVTVPPGMDRCSLELLALLPGVDDEVYVDDVALVKGVARGDEALVTSDGRSLVAAGASCRIEGPQLPTLLAVLPDVEDPVLLELKLAGELLPSDAGIELVATSLDRRGFRMAFGATPDAFGGGARGVVLELPAESASVATRSAEGGFVASGAEFEATGVREVLFGAVENRALLAFETDVTVRGSPAAETWRLEIVGVHPFGLRTVFGEAAAQARELLRSARSAYADGRARDALDQLGRLIAELPHDATVLRQAHSLRTEILAELDARIAELKRDGAEAAFFEAIVGYRRVTDGIDDLVSRYGESHVGGLAELQALRQQMAEGLAVLKRQNGLEHGAKLRELAAVFDETGRARVAEFVRSYIERHYADAEEGTDEKEGK